MQSLSPHLFPVTERQVQLDQLHRFAVIQAAGREGDTIPVLSHSERSLLLTSAAPPALTHSSTSTFLNFQNRPMRWAGIECLSIQRYTVSLLIPRCLPISSTDSQRSSISVMLSLPMGDGVATPSEAASSYGRSSPNLD